MYLGPLCYDYALNCHLVYLAIQTNFAFSCITEMHEKAKIVCFIYMQPQKTKFKSVQINMKHVSYTTPDVLYMLSEKH